MQPRFVDLHTHTTASDGTDAPRDLIRRAASLKLAAVAVTDHDTVSGLDEAEAGASTAWRSSGGASSAYRGSMGKSTCLGCGCPGIPPHWMPSWPVCVGTGKSAI